MIHLPSFLVSAVSSIALISCISSDDTAFQLMMGRSSQEIISAIGPPHALTGSLENGQMSWTKYDVMDGSEIGTYSVESYDVRAQTSADHLISIRYTGNICIVWYDWLAKNRDELNISRACSYNDIGVLQRILQARPDLCNQEVLTQAAAQAARSGSLEMLEYLVASYGIDVNATIQTWHSEDINEGAHLVLINTSIAQLLRDAQSK